MQLGNLQAKETQGLCPSRCHGYLGSRHTRCLVKRSNVCAAASPSSFEEEAAKVGRVAQTKFKELADKTQDNAQRTWRKLDAEYQLRDKAERAARKLEEQAREVDQTWNVRRRLRSAVDHVQRMWPVWSADLNRFAATWYGKTTVLVVLLTIMSSPLFWKLLNLLLIVWWLAIPVAAALVSAAQRRATERAAAEAEEAARQRNPFADMFRSAREAAGSRKGSPGQRSQGGPVIDADFTIIKDDK